jgi:eukaryotic-like serine/threonine-protein kinase
VQRYLNDEPIQACPPSAAYRLKKYAVRHRRLLATMAAFLLMLIAGTAVSTWQAVTARHRLAQIEKANDLLGAIFKDLDPQAEEKEAKELRVLLGERLERAATELQGGLVGDPLVVAKLQATLATSLYGLGYAEKAIPLYERARDTYAARLGIEHDELREVMKGLFWASYETKKIPLPRFQETFDLAKRKLGPDHPVTLAYMDQLAWAYHYGQGAKKAVPFFEELVKRRTVVLGRDDPETLKSMHGLAWAYLMAGDATKARPLFEETLNLQRSRLGPDHEDTIDTLRRLAVVYQHNREFDKAVALKEEVLKWAKAKWGPTHARTTMAMMQVGETYYSAGKLDLSIRFLEDAIAIATARLGGQHDRVLSSMDNLAILYREAGRPNDALRVYEEVFNRRKAKDGIDHPKTLFSAGNLGALYDVMGKTDLALPLLEAACKPQLGKGALEETDTLVDWLFAVYQDAGKFDRPIAICEEAVQVTSSQFGLAHLQTWQWAARLGGGLQEGRPGGKRRRISGRSAQCNEGRARARGWFHSQLDERPRKGPSRRGTGEEGFVPAPRCAEACQSQTGGCG